MLSLLILSLTQGCALKTAPSAPIVLGEKIEVDYRCTLADGSLAADTFESDDDEAEISNIYRKMAHEEYGPVVMDAGIKAECTECEKNTRHFTLILEELIQQELEGRHFGEEIDLTLSTEELLMDEKEGTISIKRNQFRPKIKPVQKDRIVSYLGREPEVAEVIRFENEKLQPVKVLEVYPASVTVELLTDEHTVMESPFGPATFSEDEKGFHLTINPQIGHLVRSGGLIGRVISFDDSSILLDYRHPFGYEQLQCYVWIRGPFQEEK